MCPSQAAAALTGLLRGGPSAGGGQPRDASPYNCVELSLWGRSTFSRQFPLQRVEHFFLSHANRPLRTYLIAINRPPGGWFISPVSGFCWKGGMNHLQFIDSKGYIIDWHSSFRCLKLWHKFSCLCASNFVSLSLQLHLQLVTGWNPTVYSILKVMVHFFIFSFASII